MVHRHSKSEKKKQKWKQQHVKTSIFLSSKLFDMAHAQNLMKENCATYVFIVRDKDIAVKVGLLTEPSQWHHHPQSSQFPSSRLLNR